MDYPDLIHLGVALAVAGAVIGLVLITVGASIGRKALSYAGAGLGVLLVIVGVSLWQNTEHERREHLAAVCEVTLGTLVGDGCVESTGQIITVRDLHR